MPCILISRHPIFGSNLTTYPRSRKKNQSVCDPSHEHYFIMLLKTVAVRLSKGLVIHKSYFLGVFSYRNAKIGFQISFECKSLLGLCKSELSRSAVSFKQVMLKMQKPRLSFRPLQFNVPLRTYLNENLSVANFTMKPRQSGTSVSVLGGT